MRADCFPIYDLHMAPGSEDHFQDTIYQHLHAIALKKMAGERYDHTLQATALVNEAWLRLGGQKADLDRSQFVKMAALAMKRILVDHARARGRLKRGGDQVRLRADWDLEGDFFVDSEESMSLVVAMQRLEEQDPRACEVVMLKILGGLDTQAIAGLQQVSERTVKRDWQFARAWLAKELRHGDEQDSVGQNQDSLQ